MLHLLRSFQEGPNVPPIITTLTPNYYLITIFWQLGSSVGGLIDLKAKETNHDGFPSKE